MTTTVIAPLNPDVADEWRRQRSVALERMAELHRKQHTGRELTKAEDAELFGLMTFMQLSFSQWLIYDGRVT